MTLTVAYYRSSSELQEDSVGTQQFYAMQYCSNNMILIDNEVQDEFVSASLVPLIKRNLSKVIEGIKKGEVNTLILYKRDRLARDVVEYMDIYSVLRKYNVQVHFTASHEAPMRYDEMGEFYELIMAGLGQHEGEQIKRRISEARSATFQKGKHKGNLPYGYVVNKKTGKIEASSFAKKDIELIFSELLSEKYTSLHKLSLFLKNNNILKLQLKESKKFNPHWHAKAIEDLVSNPMYMGMRQMNFNGKLEHYTDKDYVIINVEDWLQAQDILQKMREGNLRTKRPKGSFLFDGIIICGVCKKPLKTLMRQRVDVWVGVYECKEHKIKLLSDETDSDIFNVCCDYFPTILTKDGEELFKRYFAKQTDSIKNEIKL
ncbi:recombinase family protein [Paenibacillus qinlingensis]|uniref:DNA invertase Pin-like site-specific DNA recombinase n=1 Tax=Paenibacillus qinlingensis TaxID=1837343 RepID=A0ABU1P2J7_9BACL|nr:recombinase family protein [Paenibacillus qinlingensis]MDR6553970.1 DNA invertase Pin-like site-specific DNA recombinase [Paenibacillus qinlingensis]